jgi:hypothetical protein
MRFSQRGLRSTIAVLAKYGCSVGLRLLGLDAI